MKDAYGFPPDESFFVDADVREMLDQRIKELVAEAKVWDKKLEQLLESDGAKKDLYQSLVRKSVPKDIREQLLAAVPDKAMATRKSGGAIIQRVAELVPSLAGGAADLNPSTNTHLDACRDFSAECRAGRNVHFGVREFAMGLAANGMALYGSVIPFTATFAVFADFMKPSLRLAALQKLKAVFVFTHDSIFVGEDGPTHQPIEQMAMCRSIPGLTVIRPGGSHEVAQAWAAALECDGPVAMFLTRQTVENVPADRIEAIDVARGAYVLSDDEGPEACIIATGSELMAAQQAAEILRQKGKALRVVSMPSCELFDAQEQDYKDSVLPPCPCVKRVIIEAGVPFGWGKYADRTDLIIGIDHFGDSAPQGVLKKEYGLTPEALADQIEQFLE